MPKQSNSARNNLPLSKVASRHHHPLALARKPMHDLQTTSVWHLSVTPSPAPPLINRIPALSPFNLSTSSPSISRSKET
ncbi:hypothetical protein M440DRAFT_1404230 [Trichoderma longibrachiatum ATCC 18648]|uniref:Uncharacterized protein n=1 Tax=Trichoderma longibrachiatum ATCC 18648 TaxID=983965 RepID=A0A2T4BXL7_TRILO|nr:hypothetical protein M440DRAFT_1404230 [Trichoderma longibrachiatum ATCC 18648]